MAQLLKLQVEFLLCVMVLHKVKQGWNYLCLVEIILLWEVLLGFHTMFMMVLFILVFVTKLYLDF